MKVDPSIMDRGKARVEQVAANWVQQRQQWKTHILDDPFKRLWCVAGFIYSAELGEQAGKDKWN